MNKSYMLEKLKEKTNREERDCIIINDVLENHFIIGHNNKEKIKNDLKAKLNIDDKEADELYNICAEIIVKGALERK